MGRVQSYIRQSKWQWLTFRWFNFKCQDQFFQSMHVQKIVPDKPGPLGLIWDYLFAVLSNFFIDNLDILVQASRI